MSKRRNASEPGNGTEAFLCRKNIYCVQTTFYAVSASKRYPHFTEGSKLTLRKTEEQDMRNCRRFGKKGGRRSRETVWDDLHRLFPISLGILFVFGVILCSGIILEHELAGQPTSPGMSILSDGSASLESSLSTSASAPASTTAASTSSPSPSTT